jgi:hypothetical protein
VKAAVSAAGKSSRSNSDDPGGLTFHRTRDRAGDATPLAGCGIVPDL